MDWEGRLTPGPNGVRLLVVTLLCWGAELESNDKSTFERAEWNRLAQDFADVFDVLAAQAGPYNAPVAAQGVSEKRMK